jgi:hypothetical protein
MFNLEIDSKLRAAWRMNGRFAPEAVLPEMWLSFYAYSQSKYFVRVSLPSEVTYLRAGSDRREMAQQLPPSMGGGMSFTPIRIKDSPTSKSPATPLLPPPSPSNMREEK